MATATFLLALAGAALGEVVHNGEYEKQNSTFQQLWERDFEWTFDELPLQGGVESFRIPYSGYIYPDNHGGTVHALRKYDRAFNGGRRLAAGHEQWDATAFKEPVDGFLGKLLKVQQTPDWYGHCNGWTSASIRHAEPINSVVRNGVTFAPSDIKALLAELYVYNEHVVLAGENEAPIGAAVFHAIVANWIGRTQHPLGLEAEPGKEKWNYPAYAFAASAAKRSPRQIDVTMNVVYALDSRTEWDESPRIEEVKYFHYTLDLDAEGRIVGGEFLPDSSSIDMLWVPLSPKESGQPGNEAGNPYINVEPILSLWRESVPSETRATWLNVDPTEIIDRDRLRTPIPVVDVAVGVGREELDVPARVTPRRVRTIRASADSNGHCYARRLVPSSDAFETLLRGERDSISARQLSIGETHDN